MFAYKNTKKIEVGTFIFKTKDNKKFTFEEVIGLRGYILNQFNEKIEYHNHISKYNFNYKSPLIQYKIINGQLAIVVFDKMIEAVKRDLESLNKINIFGEEYPFKLISKIETLEIGIVDSLQRYAFELPWMAINQNNMELYKEGNFNLNNQLRNNMIEIFKALDIFAEKQVMVNGVFEKNIKNYKENDFVVYEGSFVTNVNLPDYIGLGKRKSIGYGTISSVK